MSLSISSWMLRPRCLSRSRYSSISFIFHHLLSQASTQRRNCQRGCADCVKLPAYEPINEQVDQVQFRRDAVYYLASLDNPALGLVYLACSSPRVHACGESVDKLLPFAKELVLDSSLPASVLAVFVAFLGPLADKVVLGNAFLFSFPHEVLGVPFVLCLRKVVFTDEKIAHCAHRPFQG